VPQAADELDDVLFEAHPRAPAIAEASTGQLSRHGRARQLDPGGHALKDRDKRRAMGFSSGQPAQHASKSFTTSRRAVS
jgi:hypothetical protein